MSPPTRSSGADETATAVRSWLQTDFCVNGPVDTPPSPEEIRSAQALVDSWIISELADHPAVEAASQDIESDRRWMVRLAGESKAYFTVWFELRQRTLRAETYLMPAPLERHAEVYEYLLRTAEALRGVTISIGAEDALYAHCEMPIEFLDARRLDSMLGSLHEVTERVFVTAMSLGFGDRVTA